MKYNTFSTYIFIDDMQVEIAVTVLMTATAHSSFIKVESVLNLDTCLDIPLNDLTKENMAEINSKAQDFLFECEPDLREKYAQDLIDQRDQDRLDFARGK